MNDQIGKDDAGESSSSDGLCLVSDEILALLPSGSYSDTKKGPSSTTVDTLEGKVDIETKVDSVSLGLRQLGEVIHLDDQGNCRSGKTLTKSDGSSLEYLWQDGVYKGYKLRQIKGGHLTESSYSPEGSLQETYERKANGQESLKVYGKGARLLAVSTLSPDKTMSEDTYYRSNGELKFEFKQKSNMAITNWRENFLLSVELNKKN